MNMRNSLTPTQRYKRLLCCAHNLYRLLNSTYNVKDFILRLTRLICQTLGSEYCSIILLDPTKKFATQRCVISGKDKYVIEKRTKIINQTEKEIIRNASILTKPDILAVPLIAEDVIGIIVVRQNKSKVFNSTDQDILITISQQAILGIKNMHLFEEQQKIVMGSMQSLVTLLDSRIPREYGHSPYFPELACAIGEQMHLSEKQIESLKYASLLHDAGKVDIPEEILSKTSKLTPKEYKIIRHHPIKGAKIMRSLQILKPAIPIIMHHHEKYNGTGYPSRLKKGQIPIGARIMAVADAFEAMIYGRPYRERMRIDSAINEIKKKSGTQFDPKVVDAFIRTIKTTKIKKSLKKYRK
ncbi:HD domain-containing phosphohydrolase [Candidatus Omnitrophota bacterium]